jgi:cellulose 1,4-beta-cellobiosidase
MDDAVSQGVNSIQLVIYDFPNRDCSSTGSNGELRIAQDGVNRYKTEFIDPIVAILRNYTNLRIICIVESDSIPNLVTNLKFADCAEANSSGAYVTCMQYAINQINSVGNNTYIYLDIAHSAWLGWDSNFGPFVSLMTSIVRGTTKGLSSIEGFVDNTANTLPYIEPYLGSDGNATVGGVAIKQSRFLDWNPYTDESRFMSDMRNSFISAGFPSSIGMLLDTSRNGWGGSARPTAKSTSTDLNTYVDASRIDRRYHRGNWCNQGTAGIGARPQSSPGSGIDAFVWVKPPGESDGQSTTGTDPCDPNKKLDQMCIPNGINIYCNCGENGAMAGAPVAGAWFQSLFDSLKAKAYPAL